ncbi:hypothetical protein N9055_02320 [Akkermansiaceae bacterium]|nr:hypothetical protein [Akkermansiaceae bacterium]
MSFHRPPADDNPENKDNEANDERDDGKKSGATHRDVKHVT